MKHLWKLVHESGIEIEDDLHYFEFTRKHDTTLASAMSRAHNDGLITKGGWGRANNCRNI